MIRAYQTCEAYGKELLPYVDNSATQGRQSLVRYYLLQQRISILIRHSGRRILLHQIRSFISIPRYLFNVERYLYHELCSDLIIPQATIILFGAPLYSQTAKCPFFGNRFMNKDSSTRSHPSQDHFSLNCPEYFEDRSMLVAIAYN